MFTALGSNLNPILTQLAKTRRAIFVEGNDFQILSRFARKLELRGIANRSDFAVVSVKGFNPERIRSLKGGMEISLGGAISAATKNQVIAFVVTAALVFILTVAGTPTVLGLFQGWARKSSSRVVNCRGDAEPR